jgi:uncharacterized membrane-anchored protein
VLALLLAPWAHGQESNPSPEEQQAQQRLAKLRALKWVTGPTTVPVAGNSTLKLPESYAFLDTTETAKFEELTQNLAGGKEVLVAPNSLRWVAYLEFGDEGLVKDNEKIDADAILSSLKSAATNENEERRRRGWDTLEITGWAVPPAYNNTTKRLEWATLLHTSDGGQSVNFFTKILGRRGVTSVVLVSSPANQAASILQLNQVLAGYQFNGGERYADWRPGDKVAAYGLTGLIVGGAVAAAAKTGLLKGLFKPLIALVVAGWKLIAVAVLAALAWLRSLFSRKKTGTA